MDGEIRDDLLAVEPAAARPGDEVAITWPGSEPRAIAYRMGRMAADGVWRAEYVLFTGSQAAPGTWELISEEIEIPAMAMVGPGPDRLVMPDPAVPGDYRICTWDEPASCVAVEVVER
jgi:hypothetical protein